MAGQRPSIETDRRWSLADPIRPVAVVRFRAL